MSQKTTTIEFTPKLISFDESRKELQLKFLQSLKPLLNELVSEYRSLNLVAPIKSSDIGLIPFVSPRDFIKNKAISKMEENPSVGGVTLSREKLYGMMDLNPAAFINAFAVVREFIENQRRMTSHRDFTLDFYGEFFLIDEDYEHEIVHINRSYFDVWVESNCVKVTSNELQNRIHDELENLTQSLNNLRQLVKELPDDGTNRLISVVKNYPRRWIEEYMFRAVKLDKDQFIVNPSCSLLV